MLTAETAISNSNTAVVVAVTERLFPGVIGDYGEVTWSAGLVVPPTMYPSHAAPVSVPPDTASRARMSFVAPTLNFTVTRNREPVAVTAVAVSSELKDEPLDVMPEVGSALATTVLLVPPRREALTGSPPRRP